MHHLVNPRLCCAQGWNFILHLLSLEVVCIPKLGLQFGEVETEPLKGGTQFKAIRSWKHGLGEGLTQFIQNPELFSTEITVQ